MRFISLSLKLWKRDVSLHHMDSYYIIYIYIYITEAFEAFTIFHVCTIIILFKLFSQNLSKTLFF